MRVVQSVTESMLTTRRHSARLRIKTGVKRDGTLVAREAEVLMDTGAYADNGPRVAKRAISRMLGPYKLDHCKIDVAGVLHQHRSGRFHALHRRTANDLGFGIAHGYASQRGSAFDPLEFRMRHLLKRGEVLKPGATPMDADLRQGMQAAVGSARLAKPQSTANRKGAGVAVGVSDSEAMPVSVALVRLLADGSVDLDSPGPPKWVRARGRFSARSSPQELSLPIDRVTMRGTDTLTTPFDRSTGASRSTTVMGSAVKAAAEDLRSQLIQAAAETFNTSPNSIKLSNGEAALRR